MLVDWKLYKTIILTHIFMGVKLGFLLWERNIGW
jgi:hypothetical protein